MIIREWPVNERPREKLLQQGPKALSDSELLALFIGHGPPGKTAVDVGRDALARFGNLRQLLAVSPDVLCAQPGIGPAKYVLLHAALELGRRSLHESLPAGIAVRDSAATRDYLSVCLRDYKHEVFAALFLDVRHQVIAFEELFHGTLSSAVVYPREVAKKALKHNAAGIIFAHNHPSGFPEPSDADERITQALLAALEPIGVKVLDHVVVGNGCWVSFTARGLL